MYLRTDIAFEVWLVSLPAVLAEFWNDASEQARYLTISLIPRRIDIQYEIPRRVSDISLRNRSIEGLSIHDRLRYDMMERKNETWLDFLDLPDVMENIHLVGGIVTWSIWLSGSNFHTSQITIEYRSHVQTCSFAPQGISMTSLE